MNFFVDTSALLAVLDGSQQQHESASGWYLAHSAEAVLVTHNYIIVETVALLQSRIGLDAVADFLDVIVPQLDVAWITAELHSAGLAALLTAGRRKLSLVDCISFEVMRRRGIGEAFAFDEDFRAQGFRTIPDRA